MPVQHVPIGGFAYSDAAAVVVSGAKPSAHVAVLVMPGLPSGAMAASPETS